MTLMTNTSSLRELFRSRTPNPCFLGDKAATANTFCTSDTNYQRLLIDRHRQNTAQTSKASPVKFAQHSWHSCAKPQTAYCSSPGVLGPRYPECSSKLRAVGTS